jgi:hypothetical protein
MVEVTRDVMVNDGFEADWFRYRTPIKQRTTNYYSMLRFRTHRSGGRAVRKAHDGDWDDGACGCDRGS